MALSKTRPWWQKLLGWLGYVLLCSTALVIGAGFGLLNTSPLARNMVEVYAENKQPQEVFTDTEEPDSLTLLLLGLDEDRAYGGQRIIKEGARSDMILVVRLDFVNNRVSGLSIPRDTVVRADGYGRHRINAYHQFGGTPLTEAVVEELLGVEIDCTVAITYAQFREAVDTIGGVEVNVEKPLRYTDRRGDLYIDLEPGVQVLDGTEAMGFVRYRKGDSDMHRQERQKRFLLAFKKSAMQDLLKANRLATMISTIVDNSLTPLELAVLAKWGKGIESGDINLGMLPVVDGRNYDLYPNYSQMDDALETYGLAD